MHACLRAPHEAVGRVEEMDALTGEKPVVVGPRESANVAWKLISRLRGEALQPFQRPEDEVKVISRQIIQEELHLQVVTVPTLCPLADVFLESAHHLRDDEQRIRAR